MKHTKLTTKGPCSILVIGDTHVKPDQDLRRILWLAELEADRKPDFTVCLGDFADMPSLCTYDKGKKEFEGRRYAKDIAAVKKALNILGPPPHPTKRIMLLGNHDHRINKATSVNAELDGLISTNDLGYEEAGWTTFPFKVPMSINDVTFCHYLPSGVMGYAIGGENAASSIIKKTGCSAVVGHSHLLDYAEKVDPYGKRRCALVAGCFFEHDEEYAGPANRMYRRGLAMLNNVHDGSFDLEWLDMSTLRRQYG